MSSMFISSLWNVKEPKHYSRRVGDKVPGVVAVLFSPCSRSVRLGGDVSKKARGTMIQPQVKKGLCRVLEHVDVDVDVDVHIQNQTIIF